MSEGKQGSKSTFTTSPKAEPELRLRLVGHQMGVQGWEKALQGTKVAARETDLLSCILLHISRLWRDIQEITIQSSMIKLLFSHNLNRKGMVILSNYLEQCDQQQKAGIVHGPLGHQRRWRYMPPLIATLYGQNWTMRACSHL